MFREGRDHDQWRPHSGLNEVIGLTNMGGWHVVIEATPVIPGERYRCAGPVRAIHDRVDLLHRPVLASANGRRGMVREGDGRGDPAHRWEVATCCVTSKLSVG